MVYDLGEVIKMRGREIVRAIMDKNGVSNAQLAHQMEVSLATMWDRVNSKKVKDIPLSTLNDMIRALGYKIVVVPSNKRIADGEYEVTSKPSTKCDKNKDDEE